VVATQSANVGPLQRRHREKNSTAMTHEASG
jgi:hypothetical protein